MTTAEAELELASQKRPREDEADAAAPVDAAPAAKAARLEEDAGNTARASEATEKPQDTNANDASICIVDAADVAAAAKPQAPPPPQPVPSTSAALLGLPQRWDANQLRAWLRDELRCDFTTCRKKRGGSLAFVTFPSVEARRAADAATKRAKKIPSGGRLVLRDERGGGGGGKSQGHLQQQHSRKRASEIDVRDIVTPLWRLPYEEQLAAKARRLRGVLQRIEAGIGIGGSSSAAKKNPSAAPIDFLGILRSPTTEGYRNKCEFTVGLGIGVAEEEGKTASDGKAECGFCLGAYRDGIVEVGPAAACPNVSRVAKACAAAFARFMREESALAPWDKRHNSGFWRLLIVREGRRETVLPRPPPPPRRREEGGEREEEEEGASPSSYSPPPPFASLDWRPWLVSSADLLEKEETKEETKAAATTAEAEAEAGGEAAAVAAPAPAAAAAAAAAPSLPAAPSPAPSSSSSPAFEAPPADEILLVVQVDPTAPGASDDAVLKKELIALGKALRAAVASCRAGFAPPSSSGGSSERWTPARLVLQHHSGLSNSAPDDAPLLPWPAGEEEEEAGGQGGKDEEGKKAEAEAEGGGEGESGFITDSLCGLRFRVSPSSFFQVNSGAAALLYRLALDWAGLEKKREENEDENEKKEGAAAAAEENVGEKERGGGAAAGEPAENGDGGEAGEASGSSGAAAGGPVFLDVCCGTGTIGICAAAAGAARVVGVDVVAAAVRDAEANARANGLTVSSDSSTSNSTSLTSSTSSARAKAPPSCRFVAAKAEDVMASLLAEEGAAASPAAGDTGEGKNTNKNGRHRGGPGFVAVVDPPRAGLHPKVRNALRGCPAVSRVVYVSCNPDTLASDCVHLCTRGGNGRAFRPVRAVAADLFPMTNHCEAVLLLER